MDASAIRKKSGDVKARRAIAKRIAIAVRSAGVSQAELARRLGRTPSTLTGWKNGRTQPSLEDFARLCEATGANPAAILALPVQHGRRRRSTR
jgi:replicative DNA helicase